MSEVEKIISSARDKYTVHECAECTYRKCCELGFGSAGCLSRRVSISIMLGIEDSFFSKLLDDILAAWKRERAEAVGNAAALREALARLLKWVEEHTGIYAIRVSPVKDDPAAMQKEKEDVIKMARAALSAPPRNCDMGTPDEQGERCLAQFNEWRRKGEGKKLITAIMAWAQAPYKEEGAGK